VRFLLDTCIVSDAAKPGRFPRLEAWLGAQRLPDLAIGALTFGELRYGIERLPTGRRRAELVTWLETELPPRFAGRILAQDLRVAEAWGVLRSAGEAAGRPLPVIDGLLLATAQIHGLTLVTRNDSDVKDRGVGVLNPYD
jgi:predicted nucleic acid-binding protein